MKYIALLRGINVSGKNKILMADLKKLFEDLGFSNPKTYIQTGNVIFNSSINNDELKTIIENGIKNSFDLNIKVIIKAEEQINEVLKKNPFVQDLEKNERVYITLLAKKPSDEKIEKLNSLSNNVDEFKVIEDVVYILCRKGFAESLFSNNFLEKSLVVDSTTRNLDTMNKLGKMISEYV